MKVEGQVPPFGEIDLPEEKVVGVRLVLVDGFRADIEGVTFADVDLWLATKMVSYPTPGARMFHPMSAVSSIVVFDE